MFKGTSPEIIYHPPFSLLIFLVSFKNTEVSNALKRFGLGNVNLWSRVQHVLQSLGTKRHFAIRLAIL